MAREQVVNGGERTAARAVEVDVEAVLVLVAVPGEARVGARVVGVEGAQTAT